MADAAIVGSGQHEGAAVTGIDSLADVRDRQRGDSELNLAVLTRANADRAGTADAVVSATISKAGKQITCGERSSQAAGGNNADRRAFEDLSAAGNGQIVDIPRFVSAWGVEGKWHRILQGHGLEDYQVLTFSGP
ncbi:hypothetical protein D3C75_629850 [compost metagenome]